MDISHKLDMFHLGYDSDLRLVISFLFLVYLHTCGLPDSFEHLMHATLFLFTTSFGFCTQKEIVTLSELKKALLCNKFHCFHIVASFSLSFHRVLWTRHWTANTVERSFRE